MERIKEAIEKAKAQAGSPTKVMRSAALRVESSEGVDQLPMLATPDDMKPRDGEVQYFQTSVIELDPSHLESQRIVAHQKSHPASWAFDLLRTQVLQKMDENGWRTLAVTSPNMASGKTVVAINLAIGIAQQTNRTALLIDMDLRRPRVAASLGLVADTSLNQVLTGQAQVEEAMINPGIPRLVVLPTQQPMAGSAELLGSSRVAGMMGELRGRYTDRVIVLDLPPILAADDVLAILPRVDCVLMVVGNGTTTRKEIDEAMNRLSKAHLLGVVLNKDDAPSSNAYY